MDNTIADENVIQQSQYTTNEQYSELFYLKDPLKSFEPENREIFRIIRYGPTLDEECEEINACGLKSWFIDNPTQTFYEVTEYHEKQNKELIGTVLNRQSLINKDITDQQIIDNICQQFDQCETEYIPNFLSYQQYNDPDTKYLSYTCKFINKTFEERHQIEKELPMMYERRRIRKNFGCNHTLTNCLIYCEQCQQYYLCPRCHDDEILDHQLSYQNVQKCKCLKCNTEQQVGPQCINCKLVFASQWCDKCRILRIVDIQTTPVFHCKEHNICHYNTHQDLSFSCPNCKCCFPNDNLSYHDCNQIYCNICFGQIEKEDDIVTFTCSPKHIAHQYCFSQYEQNYDGFVMRCPTCKAPQLSFLDQKLLLMRSLQIIRASYGQTLVYVNQIYMNSLYYIQCKVCQCNTFSVANSICSKCYTEQNNYQIVPFKYNLLQQYFQDKLDNPFDEKDQMFNELNEFKQIVLQQKELYKTFLIYLGIIQSDILYTTDLALLYLEKDKSVNKDNFKEKLMNKSLQLQKKDIEDGMVIIQQYMQQEYSIDSFQNEEYEEYE